MANYNVFYMRPHWFRDGICGDKPSVATLGQTHALVRKVVAKNLDEVYHQSQGEVWSPNGEACGLISRLGLGHTSMSVGDVIEEADSGQFYVVASVGFQPLPI